MDVVLLCWESHPLTEDCFTTSWTHVEKQKLESVENIPAFLRRSDIGQFVTCDELILPWRRRAAAVITSGSFQVERWVDPKGLIKSIDVLEAIRCLGSTHKHDGGRAWNVVPAPSVGHGGERRPLRV